MACKAGCVCACQKVSCRCFRATPPLPPLDGARHTTTCAMCEGPAPALVVVSDAGQKVVVKLCSRCDRAGGR